MKISLSLNNTSHIIAELDAEGYLGAHLNLRREDSGVEAGSIGLNGYDLTNKNSTRSLEWPRLDVKSGDKLVLEIDPDLQSTPPEVINESAKNLEYDNLPLEQAQQILESVEVQIAELNKTLEQMRPVLSESDFKTFAHSIGHTMSTYYDKIKRPIYRCHPSLLPEGLRNHSL